MSNNNDEKKRTPIPKKDKDTVSWIAIGVTAIFHWFPITAILLLIKGVKAFKNRKLDTYRAYMNAIGNSLAVSIKTLSKTLGKSRSEVRGVLNEMIAKNYLGPEAYIDHSRDILYVLRPSAAQETADADAEFDISDLPGIFAGISGIAGDVARALKNEFKNEFKNAHWDENIGANYHHYAPSGSAPAAEAEPEPSPNPKASQEPAANPEPAQPHDCSSGISESAGTLARLTELNDLILDDEVSAKIDRISELTGDIYAFVEKNPARAGEVRKFMNYYLPTTMKLLTSYSLLEKQSYQGENIVNARRDIEKILGTLVHAFEKQLDQLFATDAVDISSDIQVLETMIAKDGLSEKSGGYQLHL